MPNSDQGRWGGSPLPLVTVARAAESPGPLQRTGAERWGSESSVATPRQDWVRSVLQVTERLSSNVTAAHAQLMSSLFSEPISIDEEHESARLPADTGAGSGGLPDRRSSESALHRLRALDWAVAREQQTLILVESFLHGGTPRPSSEDHGTDQEGRGVLRRSHPSSAPAVHHVRWVAAPPKSSRAVPSPLSSAASSSSSLVAVVPQEREGERDQQRRTAAVAAYEGATAGKGGGERSHWRALSARARGRCAQLQRLRLLAQEEVAREGLLQLFSAAFLSLAVHFVCDPPFDEGEPHQRSMLVPLSWKAEQRSIARVSRWQAKAEVLAKQLGRLQEEIVEREEVCRQDIARAERDVENVRRDGEMVAYRQAVAAQAVVQLLERSARAQLQACETDARGLLQRLLKAEAAEAAASPTRPQVESLLSEQRQWEDVSQEREGQWRTIVALLHSLEQSQRRCLVYEQEQDWESTCLLSWRLMHMKHEALVKAEATEQRGHGQRGHEQRGREGAPRRSEERDWRRCPPSPESPSLPSSSPLRPAGRGGKDEVTEELWMAVAVNSVPAKTLDEPRKANTHSRLSRDPKKRKIRGGVEEDGNGTSSLQLSRIPRGEVDDVPPLAADEAAEAQRAAVEGRNGIDRSPPRNGIHLFTLPEIDGDYESLTTSTPTRGARLVSANGAYTVSFHSSPSADAANSTEGAEDSPFCEGAGAQTHTGGGVDGKRKPLHFLYAPISPSRNP